MFMILMLTMATNLSGLEQQVDAEIMKVPICDVGHAVALQAGRLLARLGFCH